MTVESPKKKKLSVCRFGAAVAGFVLMNAVAVAAFVGSGRQMPGASVVQDVQMSNLAQGQLYGTWSWWTAHGYYEDERSPDVVVMGSSLINSAAWAADALTLWRPIDCALHHHIVTMQRAFANLGVKDVNVVNCSIGGAMASDYYVMCRALMSGERKPKVLVLGIAPRDFIDNKLDSPSVTEPFMFFSRYVGMDTVLGRAYGTPWERAMGEVENRTMRLPLRRLHSLVVGYMKEKQESTPSAGGGNQLLSAISNGKLNVKPGDLIVPFNPTDTWYDNSIEYIKRYQNPHSLYYNTEMLFFEETLKELAKRDIKVLVVEMPTLPINRKLLPDSFWKNHISQVADICMRNGTDFLDLSHSNDFTKRDFVDTVHLNWHGGQKVFAALANQIQLRPALAAALSKRNQSVAGRPSSM